MNYVLIVICFIFLVSCNNSDNELPEINEMDAMPIEALLNLTNAKADPFTKKTTYGHYLHNSEGVTNKYLFCLISKDEATLTIQPDEYFSLAKMEIVSPKNHVSESNIMVLNNTIFFNIKDYISYFKDSEVHLRFTENFKVFTIDLDKNELKGIYLAYCIFKKLS